MTITVRAELRVAPETRDEFAKVARALAQTAANEAGTLRYDWYSSEDPTVFVVIEEYADPEAARLTTRTAWSSWTISPSLLR